MTNTKQIIDAHNKTKLPNNTTTNCRRKDECKIKQIPKMDILDSRYSRKPRKQRSR